MNFKTRVKFAKFKSFVVSKLSPLAEWIVDFKRVHPERFFLIFIFGMLAILTVFFRTYVVEGAIKKFFPSSVYESGINLNEVEKVSMERVVAGSNTGDVQGVSIKDRSIKVSSDVGFADVRVLALEDFFNSYGSPLSEYSDDFIEACEKYDINNWQLLPAIAINETNGCQTDISFKQKNCWGWGGGPGNRVVFDSFEQAIDRISYYMISKYGNSHMNAKDIQRTYCGPWCPGWEWARGVNYYVFRINDQAEKYGLERTNEIWNFNN